jgi:anti-anti-sigma factor
VLVANAGSARIVAAGELDLETAPALAETLADVAGRARRIVLDLSAVTFLDPAGAGQVWHALTDLRGRVACIPPADGAALRFLHVLRLDGTLAA